MKIIVTLRLERDDGELIDEKTRSVWDIPAEGIAEHLYDSVVLVIDTMFKTFGGVFKKGKS